MRRALGAPSGPVTVLEMVTASATEVARRRYPGLIQDATPSLAVLFFVQAAAFHRMSSSQSRFFPFMDPW